MKIKLFLYTKFYSTAFDQIKLHTIPRTSPFGYIFLVFPSDFVNEKPYRAKGRMSFDELVDDALYGMKANQFL